MKKKSVFLMLLVFALISSCAKNAAETEEESSSGVGSCKDKSFGSDVPSWIADNFDCVQVTKSGNYYVFKTNDVPEHKSAYFPEDDSRYTASMPSGRSVNPNEISEQSYTFKIPVTPTSGANQATSGDAIGVAIDGVVFYNNQAASPDTLANEVATLDTANAHPTNTGSYHYHIEPTEITDDDTKLIGVLLDGYPVFGKKCPDTNTYPSDLDTNNGHTADTGITGLGNIYHYHLADLGGDGVSEVVVTDTYYGTPGVMTHE